MQCPWCNSFNVNVYDSRPSVQMVTRRRKCTDCGRGFKTVEIIEKEYKLLLSKESIVAEIKALIRNAEMQLKGSGFNA